MKMSEQNEQILAGMYERLPLVIEHYAVKLVMRELRSVLSALAGSSPAPSQDGCTICGKPLFQTAQQRCSEHWDWLTNDHDVARLEPSERVRESDPRGEVSAGIKSLTISDLQRRYRLDFWNAKRLKDDLQGSARGTPDAARLSASESTGTSSLTDGIQASSEVSAATVGAPAPKDSNTLVLPEARAALEQEFGLPPNAPEGFAPEVAATRLTETT